VPVNSIVHQNAFTMRFPWSNNRLVCFLATLLVCFYPYAKLLKFPYNIPVLALLCMAIFAWENKSLAGMGFQKAGSTLNFVGRILIGFFIIEFIFDFVVQPVVGLVLNEPADYSSYNFLKANTGKYFLYILCAWISAAIAEEIIYRGFLIYAGEKLFSRKWIAVFVSSAIFSSAHFYQGWSGVVITFLFGVAFGIIYLRSGRNIWINIIVHGMIDSFFLTMSYTGNLSYYEKPFEFIKTLFE
jgi:membrane protease YdiL (CAAX protease family)